VQAFELKLKGFEQIRAAIVAYAPYHMQMKTTTSKLVDALQQIVDDPSDQAPLSSEVRDSAAEAIRVINSSAVDGVVELTKTTFPSLVKALHAAIIKKPPGTIGGQSMQVPPERMNEKDATEMETKIVLYLSHFNNIPVPADAFLDPIGGIRAAGILPKLSCWMEFKTDKKKIPSFALDPAAATERAQRIAKLRLMLNDVKVMLPHSVFENKLADMEAVLTMELSVLDTFAVDLMMAAHAHLVKLAGTVKSNNEKGALETARGG